MSSGRVFTALAESQDLAELGVENVFTDYSAEEIPRDGITLILRWGDQDFHRAIKNGPRDLNVWAHSAIEDGTDYTQINSVLSEVTNILEGIVQEVGSDGISVTGIDQVGSSANLRDPGFQTITRYCSYRVLLRRMV